jgi:uncharacterized SAM-binding protein YcdF (DUF218 family)
MITAFIILYVWAAVVIWFLLGTTVIGGTGMNLRVRRWCLVAVAWPALPFIIVVHGWWRRTRR